MWKKLRITILLYVAVIVAMTSWSTRARHAEWEQSLWVTIYPINGDGSVVAQEYIDSLVESDFHSMEEFFVKQARAFKLNVHRPIEAKLSAPVESLPPSPPDAKNGYTIHINFSIYCFTCLGLCQAETHFAPKTETLLC